ncbi:uncharacterized protein LOC116570945 isoform X3 [Mustela erminea]|uniref:uncharacterized protein LOC116570945 isoform X3 n=1 Tax=Mustela erminea TaxID=36723 RepID=UPI00138661C1|nr:uncharacterized protein LOC116570945 isoform X3 [Mustela erminea]
MSGAGACQLQLSQCQGRGLVSPLRGCAPRLRRPPCQEEASHLGRRGDSRAEGQAEASPDSWARPPPWSTGSPRLPTVFPLLQVAEPRTQKGGFLGAGAPEKGQALVAPGSQAQTWASVGVEWRHLVGTGPPEPNPRRPTGL